MTIQIVTSVERPFTDDDWEAVIRPVWAEFLLHEAVANEYWEYLEADFPGYQLTILEEGGPVASGNTIPFAWDGRVESLPDGVTGVLPIGVQGLAQGVRPTTLCALQAVVRPNRQRCGLSRLLIEAMAELAGRHGLDCLVAPVRPTLKHLYPLTPMESYMKWVRDDGLPFDPWLRVHARLGADVLGVAEGSMVITGTVGDWEGWTGIEFPETGDYVVPAGHVPVQIDRERDEGRYVEPNVWMRHPIGGSE